LLTGSFDKNEFHVFGLKNEQTDIPIVKRLEKKPGTHPRQNNFRHRQAKAP